MQTDASSWSETKASKALMKCEPFTRTVRAPCGLGWAKAWSAAKAAIGVSSLRRTVWRVTTPGLSSMVAPEISGSEVMTASQAWSMESSSTGPKTMVCLAMGFVPCMKIATALWIGTYDGGLGRLENDRLTRYTVREGLFNNGVFQILEDSRGYLWMFCNRGMYRVLKRELNEFAMGKRRAISSIAYGKSEGMRNAECNGGLSPAGIRARDGRL